MVAFGATTHDFADDAQLRRPCTQPISSALRRLPLPGHVARRLLKRSLHYSERCQQNRTEESEAMNYIFWLIGVIVVIAAVLSFLGLR